MRVDESKESKQTSLNKNFKIKLHKEDSSKSKLVADRNISVISRNIKNLKVII